MPGCESYQGGNFIQDLAKQGCQDGLKLANFVASTSENSEKQAEDPPLNNSKLPNEVVSSRLDVSKMQEVEFYNLVTAALGMDQMLELCGGSWDLTEHLSAEIQKIYPDSQNFQDFEKAKEFISKIAKTISQQITEQGGWESLSEGKFKLIVKQVLRRFTTQEIASR